MFVSRSSKVLSFEAILKSTMKVYKREKTLCQSDESKRKLFTKKWKTIQHNLQKYKWSSSAIPLKSVIDITAIFKTKSQFIGLDFLLN